MITEQTVREIIAQYTKHGWNLRRVLLLPETYDEFAASLSAQFEDVEFSTSEVDAAWFSRTSKKDRVAWEIRHLRENPFALIETFDESIDPDELSDSLHEMESKLIERLLK
ncbi:MAG: hypothetical protein KIS76_03135 [Pyrinomonadaceae bacterium]|nr:hypothetical protein [Pyrinomonadaceae bacterium]